MANSENGRFIGTFVNSIYGMLLGIGFSVVLWGIFEKENNQLSLENGSLIYSVVMAAFVIVVVCLYWWDWSENIEEKVKSNFSEFIIDIGILITLESLFFNVYSAENLALAFIILSVLNFFWVINFIFDQYKSQNKKNLKTFMHDEKAYRWLVQKIVAIVIYGLCWLITLKTSSLWLSGIVVIISFCIVRYISYTGRVMLDGE